MSEETTTTTTSESASGAPDGGAAGAGGDGGAGGTAAADAFAAERARLETLARDRQSAADKATAEAARLKAELDKVKGASGGEQPAPTNLTLEQVQEQVRQAMRQENARARELSQAATTAKEQYPNALPSVLDAEYESAEEMLEAVRVSHESVASHIEETLKAREEELRQRYAERLGELPAPVEATTETTTSTGIPTIEQLSAMNQDQLEALERETPGIIDKVLRSADQLTP